jgi:transcription-repair coupling factor (superfamily II helicase)
MRDLELRGAGNLLGAEQSGHIAGVGFELYCQLLRQSVARLKGEKQASAIRASVKLDFVFVGEGHRGGLPDPPALPGRLHGGEGPGGRQRAPRLIRIQARIPIAYLAETRLRIDFYRRLAWPRLPAQAEGARSGIADRFGRFGDEVKALLLITEIRIGRNKRASFPSKQSLAGLNACARAAAATITSCSEPGFQG